MQGWNDPDGDGFPNCLDLQPTNPAAHGIGPPGLALGGEIAAETFRQYMHAEFGVEVSPDVDLPDDFDLNDDGWVTDGELFKVIDAFLNSMGTPFELAHTGDLGALQAMRSLQTALIALHIATEDPAGEGFSHKLSSLEKKLKAAEGQIEKLEHTVLDAKTGLVTAYAETPLTELSGTALEVTIAGVDGVPGTTPSLILETGGLASIQANIQAHQPKPNETTTADPVNTANGEFVHHRVDLFAKGRGIDLRLERYYHSRSLHDGVLGPGWSMPILETHLLIWDEEDNKRLLEIAWGDGNRDSYKQVDSGDPNNPFWDGINAALGRIRFAQDVDEDCPSPNWEGFVLKQPDGTHYYFCPPSLAIGAGDVLVCYLRKISDPYGNAITLKRDSNARAYRIIDTVGNQLNLFYNDDTTLSHVIDWVGRRIDYSYDVDLRHLTQVDYPETQHLSSTNALGTGRPYEAYTYHPWGGDDGTLPFLGHNLHTVNTGLGDQVAVEYFTEAGHRYDKVASVTVDGEATKFAYYSVETGLDPYSEKVTHSTLVLFPDGELERFYHGEGLLHRHEVVNGIFNQDWSFIGIADPDGPGQWLTVYTYNDSYLLTGKLVTTDVLYPAGELTEQYYDSESPYRSRQGNVVGTVQYASTPGEWPALVTSAFYYEPITNQVVRWWDGLGRLHQRSYDHQEQSYLDVLELGWVSGWEIAEPVALDPTLWGLGDVNGDGKVGGTFELIRAVFPTAEKSSPSGPGGGSDPDYAPEVVRWISPLGEKIRERGPNGIWVAYEYLWGLVQASIVDPGGENHRTEYDYDNIGRLVEEVDPNGSIAHYMYDARDLLTEVSLQSDAPPGGFPAPPDGYAQGYDPRTGTLGGIHRRYYYDLAGRIAGSTPQRIGGPSYAGDISPDLGVRVHYTAGGSPSSADINVYRNGALVSSGQWAYASDGRGRVQSSTNPRGGSTTYSREPRGLVTAVTTFDPYDAVTAITRIGYDDYGREVSYESAEDADGDGENEVVVLERDGYGRTIKTILPSGIEGRVEYDPIGRVLETTTLDGSTTVALESLVYDGLDRLRHSTTANLRLEEDGTATTLSPGTVEVEYGYGAGVDELLWVSAEGGGASRLKRYVYDDVKRMVGYYLGSGSQVGVTDTLDAGGRTISRTYHHDGLGNPGPESPSTAVWSFGYDVFGFLDEITDPEGNMTEVVNGQLGLPTSVTDPDGKTTDVLYDSRGLVNRVTETGIGSLTRSVEYELDVMGIWTALVDASQQLTEYDVDGFGRVRERTFPDASSEIMEYDLEGRLASVMRAGGATITYAYNTDGLLSGLNATGAAAGVSRTFDYDALGNLRQVWEQVAGRAPTVINREWSSLGRMLEDRLSTSAGTHQFNLGYLATGELSSIGYPSGRTVSRSYDSLGRLSSIGSSVSGILATFDTHYGMEYRSATLANGSKVKQEFDGLGRILSKKALKPDGTALFGSTQVYTPGGDLDSRVWVNGVVEQMQYDGFHRLEDWHLNASTAGGPIRDVHWDHDLRDNIDALQDSATGSLDASINLLNQLTSAIPDIVENEHSQVGNQVYREIGSGKDYAWSWDALDRPIACTVRELVSGQWVTTDTIEWTYDGVNRMAERDSSAAGSTSFRYLGDVVGLCAGPGSDTREYVGGYDPSQPLLFVRDLGGPLGWAYMHVGPFGNVEALHNGNQVLESYWYDPFGVPRNIQGGLLAGSALGNDLFFLAQPHDFALGISRTRHRSYEPELGRFLSRDPLGEIAGQNLYSYAGMNPFRFMDPSGLHGQSTQTPVVPGPLPVSFYQQLYAWQYIKTQGALIAMQYAAALKHQTVVGSSAPVAEQANAEAPIDSQGTGPSVAGTVASSAVAAVAASPIGPVVSNEINKWLYQAKIVKGFIVDGGWETAKALGGIVAHPLDTAKGVASAAMHPVETTTAVASAGADFVGELVTLDPEAVGQAGFEVAMFLIGVGEVKAVGTTAKIAKAADRAGDVARRTRAVLRNVHGGSLSADDALRYAEQWLGPNYSEIAPGVYRSSDNLRQFRMTDSDLMSRSQGPHVHFEAIDSDGRTILENAHVGLNTK